MKKILVCIISVMLIILMGWYICREGKWQEVQGFTAYFYGEEDEESINYTTDNEIKDEELAGVTDSTINDVSGPNKSGAGIDSEAKENYNNWEFQCNLALSKGNLTIIFYDSELNVLLKYSDISPETESFNESIDNDVLQRTKFIIIDNTDDTEGTCNWILFGKKSSLKDIWISQINQYLQEH